MTDPRRVTFHFVQRIVSHLIVTTVLLSALREFNAAGAEGFTRSLLFPADRTVGTAYWRMPDGKPFVYAINSNAWRSVDEARGIVNVPAGADVRLDVVKAAS